MSSAQLDKAYDPRPTETRWYQIWEASGAFAPKGEGDDPFCVMLPPPNVTGSLHMGHAFQDTIMDILTRYHRMKGRPALWQPGTDHAGIATQIVVERQLEGEGRTRHDLGRHAFIERVWQWKGESGGTIVQQLRRMGASCDWSRERFTMDEELSQAVVEVFVSLFEEDLIYRGKRLVNWDPVLRTAVSDLEVISEEEQGSMWHLRYPIVGDSGYLVVATTRPETMLGDQAVAVSPEDERYKDLIGRRLILPLTGRTIPVIADDYVDPTFGTGCVKITPAHDFNDYQVGKRHDLDLLNIFTEDAKINDAAPEQYRGLDRYEARKKIVADLDAEGLLEKIEPHKLMVPRGDRTGVVIEPYLTDQWYVRVGPLAEKAIKVVDSGQIQFVPENWSKTYYDWMHRIEDWCISRQIWWGHQVPAWYGPDGEVFVARSDEEAHHKAAQHYGMAVTLERDHDVLDTWFSSALWPFTTLGWPDKTPELEQFYPTSVLVTGFDIIFFWVARMIMMGNKFAGDVPFRKVYIHGLVRDAEGQKMSKSKGNVLDPLDLIDGIELEALVAKRTGNLMNPKQAEKIAKATRKEFPEGIPSFGADAVRMTFAALATQGRDVRFDLNRVGGYRNFVNKIWNAARFVLMHTGELQNTGPAGSNHIIDRWIVSQLARTVIDVEKGIEEYRFSDAAHHLYQFVWGTFCDWYIELSNPRLAEGGKAAEAAIVTAVDVLEQILRLAHPIMPFMTEELWQAVARTRFGSENRGGYDTPTGRLLMTEPFPTAGAVDEQAETEIALVQGVVGAIRTVRGELNVNPGKQVEAYLAGADEAQQALLTGHIALIASLARLETLRFASLEETPEGGVAQFGNLTTTIPMAGLIDVAAERARLEKELGKLQKELERTAGKLSNPNFRDKAPPEVLAKEEGKLAEFEAEMAGMRESLAKLERL